MIDYKGREVLCSVRNMEVTFGKGRKAFVAVKGVNFDIYKGETFGLVGESGSGKTTIGRAIIRINPISAGEVLFKGERISGKISKEMDKMVTQKIQMIFQDPMASLNERAKVDYIVSEGLMNVHPDMKKEEREERVSQALSDVGLLPEFATRFPHEFSGGQRQRIGIARALIMEPDIADEPISALDVSIRAQVLNLMSKLQKERGLTYLFIAHDLSVMRFITDRIAVIHKGVIVELAETEKLVNQFRQLSTKQLNVIVVNFIDMLSHARTESTMVRELASDEIAYRSITSSWFRHSPVSELFHALANTNAKIVVTTDHGSIRVNTPTKIIGDKNTNTNLRYKLGKNLSYNAKDLFVLKNPKMAFLPAPNLSTSYVFAKGDAFFAYPNNYNYYVSYYRNTFQHGGISMEEMLIPLVTLTSKKRR